MTYFRQIVCTICVTVLIIEASMISAQEPEQLQLPKSTTTTTTQTPTPFKVVPIIIGYSPQKNAAFSTAKPLQTIKLPQLSQAQPEENRDLISSLVNVEKKENRSRVGVHVPLIFDMTKDLNSDRSKLDLSVLSGLVTVNKDKSKLDGGVEDGPLVVTVFGIPVYTGAKRVMTVQGRLDDMIKKGEGVRDQYISPSESVRVRKEPAIPYSSIQKVNEGIVEGIADLFSRAMSQVNKIRDSLIYDRPISERSADATRVSPVTSSGSNSIFSGLQPGSRSVKSEDTPHESPHRYT